MEVSEWNLEPLSRVTTKIGSGATPRGGASVYLDRGTAFIRSQNVLDFAFDFSGLAYVNDQAAEDLKNVAVQAGDVLINITGDSVARVCMAPEIPARVSQHVAILRADPSVVLPRFLLYAMLNPSSKQRLLATSSAGATRKALTKGHLEAFEVPVPSLDAQGRIVQLLGSLDDLIAVNRELVRDLLDLVNAVFMHRFGDRALGLKVSELAKVVDCLHTKKPERTMSGRTLLQLANILDSGQLDLTNRFAISDSDYRVWSKNIEATEWDCVITNVGRVGAVARIPAGVSAALGRNMTAVRPMASQRDGAFLIAALLSPAVRREIDLRTDSGTVMNALNVKSIPSLRLPEASAAEREAFHAVAAPLLRAADALLSEISETAQTRNELLPLLMSGRVRVGDVAA